VILSKQPPRLLIDVHGVGYEVDAPMTTFYDLPATGEEVTLFTHLAVREDAHTLYGFARASDRELFRSLLKVNGVGARLALTILSGMEPGEFIRCVQEDNSAALVRLPGVGKKTAEAGGRGGGAGQYRRRHHRGAGKPGGGCRQCAGGTGLQAAGGEPHGARHRYRGAVIRGHHPRGAAGDGALA